MVWGKIVLQVRQNDFMPTWAKYYGDDGGQQRTMTFSDYTMMGGRSCPRRLTVVPADKPDESTVITYAAARLRRAAASRHVHPRGAEALTCWSFASAGATSGAIRAGACSRWRRRRRLRGVLITVAALAPGGPRPTDPRERHAAGAGPPADPGRGVPEGPQPLRHHRRSVRGTDVPALLAAVERRGRRVAAPRVTAFALFSTGRRSSGARDPGCRSRRARRG